MMFVLLTLLLVTGLAVAKLRGLFAAVMVFGAFSLLSAAIFVTLDAVDVAFTEAAVGAGVSTILMLGTLSMTTTRQAARTPTRAHVAALVASAAAGVALFFVTTDKPRYGVPDAPVHQHVAPRYIEVSPVEVGVPNMVTSVLASYRGYDTLGETTVVFAAGVGVWSLLGRRQRRGNERKQPGRG